MVKTADREAGEMQGPTTEVPMRRLIVSEFVSLDGVMAAHVPMFDRPGEFNAALLAFFAGEPVGD